MIASHSFAALSAHSASIQSPSGHDSFAVQAGASRRLNAVVDGDVDRVGQRSRATDTLAAMKAAMEKAKEAADERSFWTTLGSLFLGPMAGTQIGGPVAGASDRASEGDGRLLAAARAGVRYRDDD